jgi:hypothetical protein
MGPARLDRTDAATSEAPEAGCEAAVNGRPSDAGDDGAEPPAVLSTALPDGDGRLVEKAEGSPSVASHEGASVNASSDPDNDWSAWLDGRPRRLKRGRDYSGDPKSVVKRAREAAEALGRLAVASRNSQGKYEYLWIQFVDGEVEAGHPCPVCAGTAFEKIQKHFLRCSACGSVLKATNDWEVEAGVFTPPSPPPRTEAMAVPGASADAHSGESFAKILGARVLSTDGREIEGPLVTEDFLLRLAFRLLRPVDVALPRIRLSVGDAGPSIRVQPPRPFEPSGPQTVDAWITIPGNMLMPRVYSLEFVLLLLPDRRRPNEYLRITASDALSFRVRKAGPRSILEMGDESHPPFRWDLEVRRDPS